MTRISILLLCAALVSSLSVGDSLRLSDARIHLRSGPQREWRSFPAAAPGRAKSIDFNAQANTREHTLILRQRDVKNTTWAVSLNGQRLGFLQEDERDMLRIFPIPIGALRTGSNTLELSGEPGRFSDDVEIRDIRIEPLPANEFVREATVAIDVTAESGPMPVKLTVVDTEGSLVPFASLRPEAYEALRTGVLYTPDGKARVGLPAGHYRIYASRGFEYSAPSTRVQARKGSAHNVQLRIRREPSIPRRISCDPHVHTFELSRHGDASVDERVLTAAGEGLDIIVATEHNRVDDYTPAIVRRQLDRWTLSVPGNEVTTALGHFNIFPARPGTPQPNPRGQNWSALMDAIRGTEDLQVIVQNHPRDLHSEYRPFDPRHHLSSVGANLRGRAVQANAMEVVNAGAMSSDVMQLVRDWFGLLTRGIAIAAIGSSDTHTVDFVTIGQARTYIDVSRLSTSWRERQKAVFQSLAEGRNLVSYGLAADLHIAGPVQRASAQARVPVEVVVYGPSWSPANYVSIYSNGQLVWSKSLAMKRNGGVQFQRKLTLTLPAHDAALVAVTTGPGVLEPFWEVRKPYQPTTDEWTPMVIGISSAEWIDGDGDGSRDAPLAYAKRLVDNHPGNLPDLVKALSTYDTSVALHTLDLLRARGIDVTGLETKGAFVNGSGATSTTYDVYSSEIRQIAK